MNQAFLTDEEFEALFGKQVIEAIGILDRYSEKICQTCGGECCTTVGCEFHSDRFDTCPIYEYRPAKCRLHYCDRVLDSELLTDEEKLLLNKPAENVSVILKHTWGMHIFLEPPVRVGGKSWLGPLGIEDEVKGIMTDLAKGEVDCNKAREDLLRVAMQPKQTQGTGSG